MLRYRLPLLLLAAVVVPACNEGGDTLVMSTTVRTARPEITGSTPGSPSSSLSPTLQGTAEPGAEVSLYTNAAGAGVPAATGVAGPGGAFSIGVSASPDAVTTFVAVAVGGNGVASEPSTGFAYRHDGTPPATPVLLGTTPASPAYESRPLVRGTAEPGATVQLHSQAGGAGPVIATTTSAADGTFSLAPMRPVKVDATVSFSVVAVDAAGNSSAPSLAIPYYSVLKYPDFALPSPIAAPGAYAIALARLDADADLDIVVSAVGSDVRPFSGDGAGGFLSMTPLSAGFTTQHVGVADINQDGRPDIVSVSGGLDAIQTFLSVGNGSFGAAQSTPTGDFPVFLDIGDVNVDGFPDVVVACQLDDAVSVHLGQGDGTFLSAGVVSTGSLPSSVALGDLDGDGRPDLVSADFGSDQVTVALGNGDGTFALAPPVSTGSSPGSVLLLDVDEDGRRDLVVVNRADSTVQINRGNGDGTFGAPDGYFVFAYGILFITTGDVNGDGRLDLAMADSGGGGVSLLLGRGDGTFVPGSGLSVPAGLTSVALGDLDGDGVTDLVTTHSGSDELNVSLGQ